MSKRLDILKASLVKKEEALSAAYDTYFASVKQANGQPLNDKRNGAATLRRWERQQEAIRSVEQGIKKTKDAIEREEGLVASVNYHLAKTPQPIVDLVNAGTLKQWRKHGHTFFVEGVDKARIVWDEKRGVVAHRFTSHIKDKEQWKVFARTYNALSSAINPK